MIFEHSCKRLLFVVIIFKNCCECFLWYFNRTKLPHSLLAFLLFLKQLLFPGNISAIALRYHIFSESSYCFPCNNLLSYRCLDWHLKLMHGNNFLQFFTDEFSSGISF